MIHVGEKQKGKKFSWIFDVLRANERTGRSYCFERRFDFLKKKIQIEVFFVFREGMKNHKRETRKKKDTYVRGD